MTGVHSHLCCRGHYFFSVHAARLMVPQGRGLIVMISSIGGLRYLFNVAYGVGKAAVGYSAFFVHPAPVKTRTVRLNACGLVPVWQACSRHGRWAEKPRSGHHQPVARSGSDGAGVSNDSGEKPKGAWSLKAQSMLALSECSTCGFVSVSDEECVWEGRNDRTEWKVPRQPGER